MVAVRTQPLSVPSLRLVSEEERPEDILAQYLPGILRQDAFLSEFLRIFDEILRPIIETIDSIDGYFDAKLTPVGLLPWLATWVGDGAGLPETATRALLGEVAQIHRDRGTKRGLQRALQIATGAEALVIENTAGLRLDADARLGINTSLATPERNAIQVTLIKGAGAIDEDLVAGVLREFKPAHATYTVRVSEG